MGSFNVACSISNISISCGDPIVYIPLEVAQYPASIGDRNIYLIYSRCFYIPAAFPIKGFYDDYGGIEHIEMDEAMLFNLHWYKKDPSNPSDVNNLWDCREGETPENITSGMFIHREIYDLLIDKQIGEFGDQRWLPDKKGLKSDFKKMVTSVISAQEMQEKMDKLLEGSKAERLKMDYMWNLPNDLRYHGLRFREYRTMKAMAKKCFETHSMIDPLIELYTFETGMYFVNAFYFPAMNGLQCGNHYMSRRLYQKSLDIVREKIKRYK